MVIAAILPCYKTRAEILPLLKHLCSDVATVQRIYVVDDACPQKTGELVQKEVKDPRVRVIFNESNLGVGGATLAGFKKAAEDGADILVKLDGDGQMDPALISRIIAPILEGRADYAKGNRFYAPDYWAHMPAIRLFGNSVLSFLSKISSGYWKIMDPTNGFVALHASVFKLLPVEKIEKRYFFESDMLFRLNTYRAVIVDVPLHSRYGSEVSNLKIQRIIFPFLFKHARCLTKRIILSYFLRDFNLASLQLLGGTALILGGFAFGLWEWHALSATGTFASSGTVMAAALPILLGFQMLLFGVNYDILSEPKQPIHKLV